jgi:hypothetical protein
MLEGFTYGDKWTVSDKTQLRLYSQDTKIDIERLDKFLAVLESSSNKSPSDENGIQQRNG